MAKLHYGVGASQQSRPPNRKAKLTPSCLSFDEVACKGKVRFELVYNFCQVSLAHTLS